VEEAARSPLLAWETFYVIVGSSAAALNAWDTVTYIVAERWSASKDTADNTPARGE
jgi:hypothetical protein